jgi:hypothetical protein
VTSARFHGEARLEFLDSVAYYEAIQVGLGERFRQSVEAAVELAGANEIVIFAVAHFKRRPGYWKSRRHDG